MGLVINQAPHTPTCYFATKADSLENEEDRQKIYREEFTPT